MSFQMIHMKKKVQKMKNKLRTAKARAQRMLNVQAKRIAGEGASAALSSSVQVKSGSDQSTQTTLDSHLQHWFFTSAFNNVQYQDDLYEGDCYRSMGRDRARSVFSLIQAMVSLVRQLFLPDSRHNKTVFHTVNVHIVDDTSTRLRGPSHADPTSIYTIMNSVQDLHVKYRQDQGHCCSVRFPTPLICLEAANSASIYNNFIGSAFVTSHGVGKILQRWGFEERFIQESAEWKTFILMGDALKANSAAYKREVQELAKQNPEHHLSLRFKCGIHQISLIRKVAVLMPPRLWGTVVRLSHLFEVLSFRRAFAAAMCEIICKSFIFIPIGEPNLPPEWPGWRERSRRLKERFRMKGKSRQNAFSQAMEFLNGDLNSDCIMHYCIQGGSGPCCQGHEDSLSRCLQLLVKFFARGYPVPLLYRFKHYDEAVSYLTFGMSAHQLLSRTLAQMDLGKAHDGKQRDLIEKLLGDLNLGTDLDGERDAIEDFMEAGDSFQAMSSKRKHLVHQEVLKRSFRSSILMVDEVIRPMDIQINSLLGRSERLNKLTLLGQHDGAWEERSQKCPATFLDYMSGATGLQIILESESLLSSGLGSFLQLAGESWDAHAAGWQSNLHMLFTMIVHIVCDTWKRLVHDHSTPQRRLFSLVQASHEEFVRLWDEFQEALIRCPRCMDFEFTRSLLKSFPGQLSGQTLEAQESVRATVTSILRDICTHAPLSSDQVEVKNGQVQHTASRRGNIAVKTPAAAKEACFLSSFLKGYELQKHWVDEKTLPSKRRMSRIMQRSGRSLPSSSNQFSNPSSKTVNPATRLHGMKCLSQF